MEEAGRQAQTIQERSKVSEIKLKSVGIISCQYFLLSSFVGALYRSPWPFLNITH